MAETHAQCWSCGYRHPIVYLYHREGGWVRDRTEGGTHALRLRVEDRSIYLCHGCMEEFLCKVDTGRAVPPEVVELIGIEIPPRLDGFGPGV